jgi:hypothetical protein
MLRRLAARDRLGAASASNIIIAFVVLEKGMVGGFFSRESVRYDVLRVGSLHCSDRESLRS